MKKLILVFVLLIVVGVMVFANYGFEMNSLKEIISPQRGRACLTPDSGVTYARHAGYLKAIG